MYAKCSPRRAARIAKGKTRFLEASCKEENFLYFANEILLRYLSLCLQLSDAVTKKQSFDTSTRKMLDNIAKEAGACKHFCPSKWAKVGGMLQVFFARVVCLETSSDETVPRRWMALLSLRRKRRTIDSFTLDPSREDFDNCPSF